MTTFFSFPHPVNDLAARTVAVGVVAMSLVTITTGWAWLLIVITYGFVARVLCGPRFSPLGRFAVDVAAPRLGRTARGAQWVRFVPGPPKRFAQAMGVAFSASALVLWLSVGWLDARWVLVPLILAASLEGFLGYCLGCTVFGFLMRRGVIPASVCEECDNLSRRFERLGSSANS